MKNGVESRGATGEGKCTPTPPGHTRLRSMESEGPSQFFPKGFTFAFCIAGDETQSLRHDASQTFLPLSRGIACPFFKEKKEEGERVGERRSGESPSLWLWAPPCWRGWVSVRTGAEREPRELSPEALCSHSRQCCFLRPSTNSFHCVPTPVSWAGFTWVLVVTLWEPAVSVWHSVISTTVFKWV